NCKIGTRGFSEAKPHIVQVEMQPKRRSQLCDAVNRSQEGGMAAGDGPVVQESSGEVQVAEFLDLREKKVKNQREQEGAKRVTLLNASLGGQPERIAEVQPGRLPIAKGNPPEKGREVQVGLGQDSRAAHLIEGVPKIQKQDGVVLGQRFEHHGGRVDNSFNTAAHADAQLA
ncbi:hypothetical protein HDU96_005170, partial [Phlyctochytrium bullatum]